MAITDPPASYGYPASRVTSVQHTALGPVAIRTSTMDLPEGWWRDEFGALHTNYAGTHYRIAEGKVWQVDPGIPMDATMEGRLEDIEARYDDPWIEVPANQVPSDNGFRRLWKQDKVTQAEADRIADKDTPLTAAGFRRQNLRVPPGGGTTSPGTSPGWENRPAAMGGPLNPEGWLGTEALAAEGWTAEEIATYSKDVDPGPRAAYKAWNKKQPYEGTYYQRAAIQSAVSKGWGRPQYTADDMTRLGNMSTDQLIQWQIQLKRIGAPGSESIVLGANDDYTEAAFRWALTQANLMGRDITSAMGLLGEIAKAEQKNLNGGYADGREKFDPVKVREQVNLTGKAKARAQLRNMMSQMLGRMPTNAEVETYLAKLNAQEKADPTVITTTYQRDGDSSTTVEQSDVDAAHIAERAIKKENPEEYRAMQSVNYYNALLDLMGG